MNIANRPLVGHEDPRVRRLFDIFKMRLDRIADFGIGTPDCGGLGHIEAIRQFFGRLEPHVVNKRDDELFMLFNGGPVDVYAIKNPSSSDRTILIEREFAEKVLALGVLP